MDLEIESPEPDLLGSQVMTEHARQNPPDPQTAAQAAPHVFWLFGLSGAGKSTLAKLLADGLRLTGVGVLLLDGDELRSGLCKGLGYSDTDRAENLRRAAEVARIGLRSGLPVVAAFITPLEMHRKMVADILDPYLSFVYVDAPLAVCRKRDVKGLYARALTGGVVQMTGITSRFEPPVRRELLIETDTEAPIASASRLLAFARATLAARTGP